MLAMRLGAVAVSAIAAMLVVPAAPASAAVAIVRDAGLVIYQAHPGEENRLGVTGAGRSHVRFSDRVPIEARSGCFNPSGRPNEAVCERRAKVDVRLDDGHDIASSGLETSFQSYLGGTGTDIIYGSPIGDIIDGDKDGDTIVGEEGSDVLLGGHGADVIDGGPDPDVLKGGTGEDVLDAIDGGRDDVVDCGAGLLDEVNVSPVSDPLDALVTRNCEIPFVYVS